MSFLRRIAIAAAAAVAIAVALAAVLTYVLTSDQLHRQVDAQLRHRSYEVENYLHDSRGRLLPASARVTPELKLLGELGDLRNSGRRPPPGTTADASSRLFSPGPSQVKGYQQVVDSAGAILLRSTSLSLPVSSATRALAARGGGKSAFSDAHVRGIDLRVLSEGFGPGLAIEFAQPLSEVNSLLSRLRLILVLIVVGGILLAALLGRLVAGAALTPLRRLTQVTEHVARTQDLSGRIRPSGEDELARLAVSFNAMLDALERSVAALDASVDAQRQLVADASHELRTPVTSLRTNIEILQAQGSQMDADTQAVMLDEVVEQIEEMTLLINDLIDLARGEEPRGATYEEVRLDALVAEVAERARRRNHETPLQSALEPVLILGAPARLERAVSNLLDNALKYSPPRAPVEIVLRGGELTVRDHGPGISAEDLPHIFDRFYRGAEARGRPGSGLGLAIVRQVAEQQGGTISAEQAPGGGTLMRLRLPGAERLSGAAAAGAETGALART
jgi:two-component system sensor histidine kinase MprB